MRKQLSVLLVGIVAATAMAAGVVHTARGTGVAGNRAGRAEFRFEAWKAEEGRNVRVGGELHFRTVATEANPVQITIGASNLRFARFAGTQAVFGCAGVRTM